MILGNKVALIFVPAAIDCDGAVVDGCADADKGFAYVQMHHGWQATTRHELTHLAFAQDGDADLSHRRGIWAVVDGPKQFQDDE